jgi:hypothetical protein
MAASRRGDERRPWPTARAALIALAIVISLFEGCPTPRASPANLATEVNQAELERWTGILGGVGVETTPATLGERVVGLSDSVNAIHGRLLAPFRPFFDVLAVSQRWSLFPIADTHPVWMHLEARCSGASDFRLVYRPNDSRAEWEETVLEYRRVRATWNPSIRGPRAAYPTFVDWVARRLFDQRPECDAIRVRYLEMTLPEPGETETQYGDFIWIATRTRAEVGR